MPVDLTHIESPRFDYTVIEPESGKPVTISLDMDKICLDLQQEVPTLLAPTGLVDKDNNPRPGIALLFESLQTGKQLPESIPSFNHFEHACRRSFNLPPKCGVAVVLAVFGAWLEASTARVQLKKNTPDSPNSPAVTQAA